MCFPLLRGRASACLGWIYHRVLLQSLLGQTGGTAETGRDVKMYFSCALPSLLEKYIRKGEESLTFNFAIYLQKDVPTSQVSLCLLIHCVIKLVPKTQWTAEKPCVCVSAFLNNADSGFLNGIVLATVKTKAWPNYTNYHSKYLGLNMAFVWYSTVVIRKRWNF